MIDFQHSSPLKRTLFDFSVPLILADLPVSPLYTFIMLCSSDKVGSIKNYIMHRQLHNKSIHGGGGEKNDVDSGHNVPASTHNEEESKLSKV